MFGTIDPTGLIGRIRMEIKKYFTRESVHGIHLLTLEWVVLGYALLTLLIVLFGQTQLQNPDAMIWERVRLVAVTVGMWVVWRIYPTPITRLLRVAVQLALLKWWYTDTYYINCLFPNLDPLFAQWEQALFGFQPALVFCEQMSQWWMGELMDMAYVSYYPIFAVTAAYYFFVRYNEFERAALTILASFFTYYIIFDLLPVTGPMFYYKAIGMGQVAQGVFPEVGQYFLHHTDMLPTPGYADGIFHQIVEVVHASGERPTAAFPSSHVGIAVVCMLLAWRSGSRTLFFAMLPFAILICFATVYIRAHYAIDVLAGLITGILFYLIWWRIGAREQAKRK